MSKEGEGAISSSDSPKALPDSRPAKARSFVIGLFLRPGGNALVQPRTVHSGSACSAKRGPIQSASSWHRYHLP